MGEIRAQISVEELAPGSAGQWFEAVSSGTPAADDVRKLEALLAGGPLRPQLRLVCLKDRTPFGRLGAEVKQTGIALWNPKFRAGAAGDNVEAAMRLMIARVASARRKAGLEHLPVENRSGDDLEHNAAWVRALERAAYVETCVYRLYALPLDRARRAVREPAGLTVHDIDRASEDVLVALYRSAKSQTLEQRDADCPAEVAMEIMRKIGRGRDQAVWLIARLDGAPAGYALANVIDDPAFDGPSALVVDIGCVPQLRRKAIASALLGELIERVRAAGLRRLLAAIDDVNIASIGLHASLGFQTLPDAHYIHRLAPQETGCCG